MPIYTKIKFTSEKVKYFYWENSILPITIKPLLESLRSFPSFVSELVPKDQV